MKTEDTTNPTFSVTLIRHEFEKIKIDVYNYKLYSEAEEIVKIMYSDFFNAGWKIKKIKKEM